MHFKTLAEAIAKIGHFHPANGFTFQDDQGVESTYYFPQLERATAARAAGLARLGMIKGDRVGLVIVDPENFVLVFLAMVRLGIVPVPISPPMYLASVDTYVRQVGAILTSAHARLLIVSEKLVLTMQPLAQKVAPLERIVTVGDLHGSGVPPPYPSITPEDIAFLQYTSGSTMDPRGVIVSHRALMNNVEAFMGHGLKMNPSVDRGVSWLPLYHDMGLVGFVLGPVVWGVSVTLIPTFRFIKNPSVWFEAVNRHRGTVSFGPNFAFSLAAKRVRQNDLDNWDLSCLKTLGCGAEPIYPSSIRRFLDVFGGRCKLHPSSITPAYGLAECTLATTMKPLGQAMRTRVVERSSFEAQGLARDAVSEIPALEHVSCGVPLADAEIRVLNSNLDPLAENSEGAIWIRGSSIASGYFGLPDAWADICRDGWLRTGDLGYLFEGELYVTGRSKDLIILNGRNHHPQSIEWAVAEVDGVREGSAVAFSRPGEFGEELVVAVEVKNRGLEQLLRGIYDAVQNTICTSPAEVVCLRPGTIPKTSSGKLRRQQLREQYLRTRLSESRSSQDEAKHDELTGPSHHGP